MYLAQTLYVYMLIVHVVYKTNKMVQNHFHSTFQTHDI